MLYLLEPGREPLLKELAILGNIFVSLGPGSRIPGKLTVLTDDNIRDVDGLHVELLRKHVIGNKRELNSLERLVGPLISVSE